MPALLLQDSLVWRVRARVFTLPMTAAVTEPTHLIHALQSVPLCLAPASRLSGLLIMGSAYAGMNCTVNFQNFSHRFCRKRQAAFSAFECLHFRQLQRGILGALRFLRRVCDRSASAIHASSRRHWWTFLQAGHRTDILRFAGNESNTIVSVVSPVGTFVPRIGQRIIISGTK